MKYFEKKNKAKQEPETKECTQVHVALLTEGAAKTIGKQLGMEDINAVIGYCLGLTTRLIILERKGYTIMARDRRGEGRVEVINVLPPKKEA